MLRRGLHAVGLMPCGCHLKFLIILFLNLCFVSKVQWDSREGTGGLEAQFTYGSTSHYLPISSRWVLDCHSLRSRCPSLPYPPPPASMSIHLQREPRCGEGQVRCMHPAAPQGGAWQWPSLHLVHSTTHIQWGWISCPSLIQIPSASLWGGGNTLERCLYAVGWGGRHLPQEGRCLGQLPCPLIRHSMSGQQLEEGWNQTVVRPEHTHVTQVMG